MAKELNLEKVIKEFQKVSLEERLSAFKKLGEWITEDIQKQKALLSEMELKIKTQ